MGGIYISKGIYKITNINNNKVYIGSSSDIERRFLEHKRDLKENKHHSYKMQNDFNLNKNIEDFVFEVIENINGSKADLFRREQFYIDKYDAYNSGYNCCEYSVNPKYAGNRITNIYSKPTNIPRYVTIPKEIIYDKNLGDKRVIVYSYLCSRRALDDSVAFSINELVKWTGLIPNYHEGKINHKYLDYLELLSHYGYFDSCPDFIKLKSIKGNGEYYYKAQLNIEKFDIPKEFGIIYFDELQKIINFKEELKKENIDTSRLSSAYILLLLAYIRANINRSDNKPRCCFRLYKTISEDIGISERYIARIVEILDVMNIIAHQEGRRTRYSKSDGSFGFNTAPKVFADYRKFIRDEHGNTKLDDSYDFKYEIQKQIEILNANSS